MTKASECGINKSASKSQDFWHPTRKDTKNVQHIFSEAPLPLSLVEEVVEVAAKGDENKAEGEESKYAWQGETEQQITDTSVPIAVIQKGNGPKRIMEK